MKEYIQLKAFVCAHETVFPIPYTEICGKPYKEYNIVDKMEGLEQTASFWVVDLSVMSCVALSKLFNLSLP